jgi:glutaredoxin
MENQNATSTNAQGGDLSDFRKAFNDYQNGQVKGKRKTKEQILAKYFVPRNIRETFRILPYKTKFFFTEAFFHVVDTNIAGAKVKHGTVIYCPAHNDPKVPKLDSNGQPMLDGNGKVIMIPAPCPLCAKAKKILSTQDPSLKNVKKEDLTEAQKVVWEKNKKIFIDAGKWEAKKFYIVKGIDKGAEKDGVKFWRFKHNFKNQGTLDKLFPILDLYNTTNGVSFADAHNGTDLDIVMADTVFNNRTYKTISAIAARGKSPLHSDPIMMQQWLDDKTTWRDVFLPKKAPNTTPVQFLEMVANGVNPYWEDTDAANKHWVFPGNPELERLANTRKANLDGDVDDNFEQASDLDEGYTAPVTISNITPNTVGAGTYKENAVDITAKQPQVQQAVPVVLENIPEEHDDITGDVDYEDLPF